MSTSWQFLSKLLINVLSHKADRITFLSYHNPSLALAKGCMGNYYLIEFIKLNDSGITFKQ